VTQWLLGFVILRSSGSDLFHLQGTGSSSVTRSATFNSFRTTNGLQNLRVRSWPVSYLDYDGCDGAAEEQGEGEQLEAQHTPGTHNSEA